MYKILIATDGSKISQNAVNYVMNLLENQQKDNVEVSVISVYNSGLGSSGKAIIPKKEYARVIEYAKAQAEQAVNSIAAVLEKKGIKVNKSVEEGDPAQVIAKVAKSINADQIVMGTRGLSDLKGMLMGSVSRKVVHLAHCPVVLVKSGIY